MLDQFAGCQPPDEETTQDHFLEKVIDEHVTQDDTKLTHGFVHVLKGERPLGRNTYITLSL